MISKKSKKRKTVAAIILVPVAYIVICTAVMGVQLALMGAQGAKSTAKEKGERRLEELEAAGVRVEYEVYSDSEMSAGDSKEDVRLYYFPAEEKTDGRFVLICPGGAYHECAVDTEGFPIAAEVNRLGHTAFVLEYRVGEHGGNYAALEDLARAVRFIGDNAGEFGVDPDGYALMGFSAGGNLIGLFGSEDAGYAKYGARKPACLIMGYPWCNLNVRSVNVAKVVMYSLLNSRGYDGLIGKGATKRQKKDMRVPPHVTADYPPTYIMHGKSDFLVPASTHSDALYKALTDNGVRARYELCPGVYHGVGLGENTAAQGWIERALDFRNGR